MRYQELTRELRALGCTFMRQSKGSHEIWHNPKRNLSAVIPNHPGDLPKGTLHAILKQLGIDQDKFDST